MNYIRPSNLLPNKHIYYKGKMRNVLSLSLLSVFY